MSRKTGIENERTESEFAWRTSMQSMISRTLALLAVSFVCAVPLALAQQVVLLDFDTGTDGSITYTSEMRDDIEALMEGHYADFDVTFTQTTPASGPYSTLVFNSGGAGGLASKIDFRNQDPNDTAVINVDGLMGVSTTAEIVSATAIIQDEASGTATRMVHPDSDWRHPVFRDLVVIRRAIRAPRPPTSSMITSCPRRPVWARRSPMC